MDEMGAMPYSVLPVEAADLPILAQFLIYLKGVQPTNQFLWLNWPDESEQMQAFVDTMERNFRDPSSEMFKVVDGGSGEIIANLTLARNRPEEKGGLANEPNPEVLNGMNPEFRAVMRSTMREVQKDMVGIDHFVLRSIFVKSSSRVKGIGSQLVQMCRDKAKAAGVPLCLASVPSAHGFYLKLGFKDTKHGDIDLSKWGPEYGGFGVYRLFGMQIDN